MVLRWMVQQWLRQKAQETVYSKVREAAARGAHAAGEADQAEASDQATGELPPAQVGLVFALGMEAGGFEDKLTGVTTIEGHGFVARQGNLEGRPVAILRCGVGREAAARGCEALLAGHRPPWIISAGFAGALNERLKRGHILMADELVGPGGERLAIDLKVDPATLASSPGVHVGRLLTVDEIVRRAEDKRRLGLEHGAAAVDMESWAVGDVCRREKVRFLSVRVITDEVDDELPSEIDHLARQKTFAARLGAAAGAVVRRPSSVKDMLKLKEQALLASDRLAAFLAGVIHQLTPPDDEPR